MSRPRKKAAKPADTYRIVLTLTRDQVVHVEAACEFYSRVLAGQVTEVTYHLAMEHGPGNKELREAVDRMLAEWVSTATGLGRGVSYGIHGSKTPRTAQVTWDVYQALRHRRSWDDAGNPPQREFPSMWGVCYDDPMWADAPVAVASTERP